MNFMQFSLGHNRLKINYLQPSRKATKLKAIENLITIKCFKTSLLSKEKLNDIKLRTNLIVFIWLSSKKNSKFQAYGILYLWNLGVVPLIFAQGTPTPNQTKITKTFLTIKWKNLIKFSKFLIKQ